MVSHSLADAPTCTAWHAGKGRRNNYPSNTQRYGHRDTQKRGRGAHQLEELLRHLQVLAGAKGLAHHSVHHALPHSHACVHVDSAPVTTGRCTRAAHLENVLLWDAGIQVLDQLVRLRDGVVTQMVDDLPAHRGTQRTSHSRSQASPSCTVRTKFSFASGMKSTMDGSTFSAFSPPLHHTRATPLAVRRTACTHTTPAT
jgi:hypothetical protein